MYHNGEQQINNLQELKELVTSGERDWRQYGDVLAEYNTDLVLFKYTTAAQFAGRWNWFERVSRGLLMNVDTGEVVARPFDKFFNWGEGGHTNQASLVEVTEKIDGSLGILYRHKGAYHIATRGAFNSEQAEWATNFLNKNYDLIGLSEDLTLLFEIIYPGNRIVVDYGDQEDLVLVGVRNRKTGEDLFYDEFAIIADTFGFGLPKTYQFSVVEDVIQEADSLPANREGWVLRFADGQRYKLKGQAYREIHRIVTNTNFNHVLSAMAENRISEMLNNIPDEYLDQIRVWQREIEATVNEVQNRVAEAFAQAPKDTRKEFALWVKEHYPEDSSYLFARLDDQDIRPLIYQRAFTRKEA